MIKLITATASGILVCGTVALALKTADNVSDDAVSAQRTNLAASTDGKGFGPQSPRDIDSAVGRNQRVFGMAPPAADMTLCDIHFHKNAEHRGGQFTRFAGNGDGKGYRTGYKYDGELTEAELQPVAGTIGASSHGNLEPGDTIEIHFVHSTAQASLGNGLGTCLSDSIGNPQLRVEAVVAVLVNNTDAVNFVEMAKVENIDGLNQVPNLPDLGAPVVYAGSTTGPSYNEKGSPFQVTWSVRPNVVKLDINSLGQWLGGNEFDETYAHGVRNLVTNPDLLSPIQ